LRALQGVNLLAKLIDGSRLLIKSLGVKLHLVEKPC